MTLKGVVHPNLKICPIFYTPLSQKSALVAFSNPHNQSGISLREKIPRSTNTADACGIQVLRRLKNNNNNKKST